MKREKRYFSYKLMYKLSEKYFEDILRVLTEADHEFIPPLSLRKTTTDRELDIKTPANGGVPTEYFESLKGQCFILAFSHNAYSGKTLAGFLSYKPDYKVSYSNGRSIVGQYISTIVVSPAFRNQGIARALYEELIRRSPGKDILTRTWSSANPTKSNISHITVLTQLGFEQFECLKNDRGEGIDTVYFRYTVRKISGDKLSDKIKRYDLSHSIMLLLGVVLITVISLVGYIICKEYIENDIVLELLLAVFTSLLVTILTCLIDIVREYREKKDDELISNLYDFGITSLSRNKHALLLNALRNCREEIWITGYRLVLTNDLLGEFEKAVRRGATVDILLCPPWSEAYKLVYGDAPAIDNYFDVLTSLGKASDYKCRVHFTDKPIFNDTYKLDKHLITGPYMHNRTDDDKPITAKDFFCYDLINESELFQLIYQEYRSLFDESKQSLNWETYLKVCKEYYGNSDTLSDEEKSLILKKAVSSY